MDSSETLLILQSAIEVMKDNAAILDQKSNFIAVNS